MSESGNRRSRQRSPRWTWILTGSVALLVVAVLGSWMMLRDPGPPLEAESSRPPAESPSADQSGPSDSPGSATPTGSEDATEPEASPAAVGPPATGETETVEKPSAVGELSFDETAPVADELEVEVVAVDSVTAGRDIPGEVRGPAVKVEIQVENVGGRPVDTSGASVNLTYGDDDRIPAPAVVDDASAVLPVSLAPGATAVASYTFSVPLDRAGNVRIMVDVLAEEPDVVFTGPRP